jgi:hypothetical protein
MLPELLLPSRQILRNIRIHVPWQMQQLGRRTPLALINEHLLSF